MKAFRNDLSNTAISYEDYDHAQNVWREFNCQNLGVYSDPYLKTDILLLADVFENFRESCIKKYGLAAAHYYTAPGLSLDAKLTYMGVVLDTLGRRHPHVPGEWHTRAHDSMLFKICKGQQQVHRGVRFIST